MLELSDLLSFIVTACLLAIVGEGVVRLVGPSRRGWRGLYHRTLWAHPVLAGAFLAFATSLPVPAGMGAGMAGRLLWFALAGGLSTAIYRLVRNAIATRAKAADVPPARPPP